MTIKDFADYDGPRPVPPPPSHASDEPTEESIQWAMTCHGISRDEAIKRLKQKRAD